MKKSTWQHLRIPFSFFLMPVFLFAASISPIEDLGRFVLVFFILHMLLYPASNGYNSYFDKDEGSIGGLKNPPKVAYQLYVVSLIFDGLALLFGLLISWQFMVMLFIYGAISKAYSHPSIRLKKMPYIGWFAAGFFQGYFTFLMAYMGIFDVDLAATLVSNIQLPALLSSILLWGSYPMTQVYQHEEDSKRGDITISLKLGILGTFHFTAIMFTFAAIGFVIYYASYFSWTYALVFQISLLPMLVFFIAWYLKVRKDKNAADFERTMRLNMLSSLILNIFFAGCILMMSASW
uniref:UbiA family prenyltransferase n=1 Tax=Fulvivirga sp. TaxID=1931237 RepID=UPI00404AF55C